MLDWKDSNNCFPLKKRTCVLFICLLFFLLDAHILFLFHSQIKSLTCHGKAGKEKAQLGFLIK